MKFIARCWLVVGGRSVEVMIVIALRHVILFYWHMLEIYNTIVEETAAKAYWRSIISAASKSGYYLASMAARRSAPVGVSACAEAIA